MLADSGAGWRRPSRAGGGPAGTTEGPTWLHQANSAQKEAVPAFSLHLVFSGVFRVVGALCMNPPRGQPAGCPWAPPLPTVHPTPPGQGGPQRAPVTSGKGGVGEWGTPGEGPAGVSECRAGGRARLALGTRRARSGGPRLSRGKGRVWFLKGHCKAGVCWTGPESNGDGEVGAGPGCWTERRQPCGHGAAGTATEQQGLMAEGRPAWSELRPAEARWC